VKLTIKNKDFGDKKLSKMERVQKILKSKPKDIFNIYELEFNPPGLAEIEESIPCDICGELTMNNRLMFYENSTMCIPCYRARRK